MPRKRRTIKRHSGTKANVKETTPSKPTAKRQIPPVAAGNGATLHISSETAATSIIAAMARLCARFAPGDMFGNALCFWFFVIATLYITRSAK